MEKLRQTKQLKAMLHILASPQGVSEKSINRAAHKMSGRNIPTDLERQNNIKFVKPRVRKLATDGSRYSIYQLKDIDQVYELIKVIKHHCLIHKFRAIEQSYFDRAIQIYEAYFKAETAKKN
jgi:hypothetical protein|tara:strand:+ start:525 stop:890 length:366 start_codon:yes stop_codon:yes gene_type:complete